MLQEPYYFLHLANTYVGEIDNLLPKLVSADHTGPSTSGLSVTIRKPASELTLRIKLLFQDFEKGELFLDHCIGVDDTDLLRSDDQEKLRHYRKVLCLFMEHLDTYRVTVRINVFSNN